MTMSEDRSLTPVETWTLDTAQVAVRSAIENARNNGALEDAAIELLTEQAGQVIDLVTLHHLVEQTPALDVQICRYPTCFHPRRAPASAGGRPPAYCSVVKDARGEDAHTAIRSMRERKRLEAGDVGTAVEPVASPAQVEPVTDARKTLPERAARVELVVTEAVATITRSLAELRTQVATLGDEELVAAEIEHVRNDANRQVQQADGARLEADRVRRLAVQAAENSARDLAEAVDAAEAADRRAEKILADAGEQAERDRQAVEAAQATTAQVREQAAQQVAQAQADAAALQQRVEADRERVLAERQAEHERLVAEIRAQAERAVVDAQAAADRRVAEIEQEATAKVAAAEADAAEARGDLEELGQELDRVRETAARDQAAAQAARDESQRVRGDLERLQTRMDQAEQRHRDELAEARVEATKARGQVEAMQTRMDQADERHRGELDRVREEHQQQRQQDREQWTAQQVEVTKAHQAQVATLEKALDTARTSANTTAATSEAAEKKGTKR
jgi:hypothetical protein